MPMLLRAPRKVSLAAALLATAAGAATAAEPSLAARIDGAVGSLAPRYVEIRRHLHQNPELSNREVETAKLVAEHLKTLGLEPQTGVAHTGVVALLQGGRPGPLIAVRADLDALPVTEDTDLPFKSTKRTTYLGQEVGVAHACGHDIHTSVQLGVAAVLASVKAELPGSILFIFQPAEEGVPPGERGGAELMLEEGVFAAKPEAVFALHSFPDFPVGQVGIASGPMWAASDQFVATLIGKQSHGAYPHQGVDPVVMAAQAILALQTIRSRNLPPLEPTVISVGMVRGGERFNIIPGQVQLQGTVRTYKDEVQAEIERRMREILDGVARAAGGSYELTYTKYAPATLNDPALFVRARPLLEEALGAANVKVVEPTMGAEDFAYFSRQVPGFYFRLGVVRPGTVSGGLHTPNFRADDSAVAAGMRAMARLLAGYLTSSRSSR